MPGQMSGCFLTDAGISRAASDDLRSLHHVAGGMFYAVGSAIMPG
jgi:hypothetical protein